MDGDLILLCQPGAPSIRPSFHSTTNATKMPFSNPFNPSAATLPKELREEANETYEHVVAVAYAMHQAGVDNANLKEIRAWGKRKFDNRKNPVQEGEFKRMMKYADILFHNLSEITPKQMGATGANISFDTTGWAKTYYSNRKSRGLCSGSWPDPASIQARSEGELFGKQFVDAVILLVLNLEEGYEAVKQVEHEFDNLISAWQRGQIYEQPQKRDPELRPLHHDLIKWSDGISKFTEGV